MPQVKPHDLPLCCRDLCNTNTENSHLLLHKHVVNVTKYCHNVVLQKHYSHESTRSESSLWILRINLDSLSPEASGIEHLMCKPATRSATSYLNERTRCSVLHECNICGSTNAEKQI